MKQLESYVTGTGDRIKILVNRDRNDEDSYLTIIVAGNAIHVSLGEALDLSSSLREIMMEKFSKKASHVKK